MTEIEDLKTDTGQIRACPVLMADTLRCGALLDVVVTTTVRGDDYGSWTEYDVHFACGHSFDQMRSTLRHEEGY